MILTFMSYAGICRFDMFDRSRKDMPIIVWQKRYLGVMEPKSLMKMGHKRSIYTFFRPIFLSDISNNFSCHIA